MEAIGADMKQRGARADEFLQVLKAIWTTNPVEFHGKFFQVPKSYIGPKPVQKPHPPIYLAAFAPPALKRLATMADGWNPVMIPVAGMADMFDAAKQMAKEAGRDPSSLSLVVRANLEITEKPLGKERVIFSGTLEQIKEDIAGCRQIGAHEIFFDPTFMPGAQSLERWLGADGAGSRAGIGRRDPVARRLIEMTPNGAGMRAFRILPTAPFCQVQLLANFTPFAAFSMRTEHERRQRVLLQDAAMPVRILNDRVVAKRSKGHFPDTAEIVAAVSAALKAR